MMAGDKSFTLMVSLDIILCSTSTFCYLVKLETCSWKFPEQEVWLAFGVTAGIGGSHMWSKVIRHLGSSWASFLGACYVPVTLMWPFWLISASPEYCHTCHICHTTITHQVPYRNSSSPEHTARHPSIQIPVGPLVLHFCLSPKLLSYQLRSRTPLASLIMFNCILVLVDPWLPLV